MRRFFMKGKLIHKIKTLYGLYFELSVIVFKETDHVVFYKERKKKRAESFKIQ